MYLVFMLLHYQPQLFLHITTFISRMFFKTIATVQTLSKFPYETILCGDNPRSSSLTYAFLLWLRVGDNAEENS